MGGGIGPLILAIRMLNKGLVRYALNALLKEVEFNGVKRPLMEWALAKYARDVSSCPLIAHLLEPFVRLAFRLICAWTHADEGLIITMLKDPAVRRGIITTLRGIAMFGVTTPQKMPAPFFIVWNFTNMCNLRCLHCYQNAGKTLPNELTLEEKLKVVDELDRAGVTAIALSGGEPTIHPDFFPIIAEASRRGFYTAVATNGLMFANYDFALKAKKAGLRYVEISIDAADPKIHDRFRGVPGAWEKAIKGLQNAIKLGFSTALAFTVTKYNIHEVPRIIELAEELGVQRIVFFNFIPVGRGREIAKLDLSPEERERFLRYLYVEARRRKIEILSTAPQYGRVVHQMSSGFDAAPTHFVYARDPITKELTEFIGGCGAGRVYAALEPEGTLTPCVFLPRPVGSLREKRFWELWMDPFMQSLRDRGLLRGFCGLCPYKLVCGGCRARAFNYLGDHLGPDPGCIYNKDVWLKIVEQEEPAHPENVVKVAFK